MCGTCCRRLLLFAMTSFAVLGPVGLAAAACPPRPLPPCSSAPFTGRTTGGKGVGRASRDGQAHRPQEDKRTGGEECEEEKPPVKRTTHVLTCLP